MLQKILKEATKNKHTELEQLMFVDEIMAGTLSLQQYKQILSTNYIIHSQFESKLHDLLNAQIAHALTLERRIKTTLLKEDLLQINANIPIYNADSFFKEFENEAAAMGALYVLEGATLGGNVIVKKLKISPNFISLDLHFYYYQVYGENLGIYWKEFCETLNNQPLDAYDQVIEGANNMFDNLIFVQKKMIEMV